MKLTREIKRHIKEYPETKIIEKFLFFPMIIKTTRWSKAKGNFAYYEFKWLERAKIKYERYTVYSDHVYPVGYKYYAIEFIKD